MSKKVMVLCLLFVLLSGCTLFGTEEREYLWYNVRVNYDTESELSALIGGTSAHFGYIKDGQVYSEGIYKEKYNYNYSLNSPISVPKIGINPADYMSMAERKVKGVDKSAEFISFNYIIPQITKIFLDEERPSAAVVFDGKEKSYLVLYDAETKKEILFREADLGWYPVCRTTAESAYRKSGCAPELNFPSGAIPFSVEIQRYWTPSLGWIKNNTDEDSKIMSWWDYYSSIELLAERDAFPESNNMEHITEAAKFLSLIEDEALEMMEKYDIDYVVLDYTMIGKSGAPHFIATSDYPDTEGERMDYTICYFSERYSVLEPRPVANAEGGFDMVGDRVFLCGIPPKESSGIAIGFDIINYKDVKVKIIPTSTDSYGLLSVHKYGAIPWDEWREETNASILGLHSLTDILQNTLVDNAGRTAIDFPTFTTLVYVPRELNGKMMTSLYLGDYIEEYKELGLCDPSVQKLEHFELVDGFEGTPDEHFSGRDPSFLGYVRVYRIVGKE
jgi:hypothetical protein